PVLQGGEDVKRETYETVELNAARECRFDEGMRIEVLMPECVSFDCSAMTILVAAKKEVDTASSGVDRWEDEKVLSWLNLRQDYQRAVRFQINNHSSQQYFGKAMGTLCESLEFWGNSQGGFSNKYNKKKFEKCIDRWRNRDLEIGTHNSMLRR
ncbi:hypothetical protein, partial [Roseibium sp. RKSG952]|uniref:hypothetical protein n=1 Tax=Roseibium sp. RKSG952 TaxID=2529384 RepID=UPI0018AD281A